MKELIELRIHEQYAPMLLRPDEGRSLMGLVRQVFLPMDDPRLIRIGELDRQLGSALFSSWKISRRYSARELAAAKLLHLDVSAIFEPAGEECGTKYDNARACPVCKAGRTRDELRLDLSKVPPRADIASTIARDEVIISDRLAGILERHGITGFQLRPVIQRSGSRKRSGRKASDSVWHELVISSHLVDLTKQTRAGDTPFDQGVDLTHACPLGDTIGLNLLSELYVDKASIPETDFMRTRQYVGIRRGLLVPASQFLVTRRLYDVLLNSGIRGFRAEVAHGS